jgi:hypothetical protein
MNIQSLGKWSQVPVQDRKIQWAKDFQENYSCKSCPFVKHEVDVGVGMGLIRDCDYVCMRDVDGILAEMELIGS